MATKSILKNVTIKDKQFARTFISALEEVSKSSYKPMKLTRECTELKGDQIREFFKE